jgi:hypothetical protein
MSKNLRRSSSEKRAVLGVSRERAASSAGRKQSAVLLAAEEATTGAASKASGTHEEAIDLLLHHSGAGGAGRCILILGNAQYGKTTFARKLANAMLERSMARAIVVHDVKYDDHAQYVGREVFSPKDAAAVYLDDAPRWLVMRTGCTAEDAASVVKRSTLAGEPACLLVDETMMALRVNDTDGAPIPKVFQGPDLTWIPIQGGGPGASAILLSQMSLWVPQAFSANAIVVAFSTGGLSLNNALSQGLIPAEAGRDASRLGVGQCLIFPRGFDWDGRVYYSPEK